jgi:murein DD-endopeptidase MepM/ murein hydrolase activator NlpD
MRRLVLALLLFLAAAPAVAGCEFKYARVIEQRSGDHVDVLLENLVTASLTVTWHVDVEENVHLDRALPLTQVVPGRATRLAFRVALPVHRKWRYHYTYRLRVGDRDAHNDPDVVYRLPYRSGQAYRVLQGFNGHFSHSGADRYAIDWAMPVGTEIHAARAGTVVMTVDGFTEGGPDRDLLECANRVIVRHDDGTYGEYGHLRFHGVAVKVGEAVKAGDLLGWSGFTGFATEPHLHFIVYRPVDGEQGESFPIRFEVAGEEEPIVPVQGETWRAR